VDTRLHRMWDMNFNKPFWSRGNFPAVVQNGTETVILSDPWVNGTNASPFDQCKETLVEFNFWGSLTATLKRSISSFLWVSEGRTDGSPITRISHG
jgi:hypothetical protein